jgi:hypothetical protein
MGFFSIIEKHFLLQINLIAQYLYDFNHNYIDTVSVLTLYICFRDGRTDGQTGAFQ